ncbi:MAG: BlaI/MecI/CopY family transcriptional regulator [Erysipelotrichaceae bacterium]|nr:BlaI/MecI/CopY family transcriptional regulator [Erysipelotrichaceae bacterium]
MLPNGLTRRESQIMTILWNSERPLSAAEVVAIAPELSKNTIQIVLKKLLTLGYVEVAGFTYSKNALTRTFKPIIEQSEYLLGTLSEKTALDVTKAYIAKAESKEDLEDLAQLVQTRLQEINK